MINEIANSAEHIFFNSYDKLLKKQEHDIQVAAQKRAAEAEELRIKSWKEITIEVFEKKTIEKLDKIVEENPDTEFDKFIFDEYSKDVFKKLLYYFHGQAEKVGLIQNKPIALLGNIGVGKNTMMEAFCDNPYRSFIFHTSRDFTKAYSGNWGDNILEYFSEKSDINNYGHQYYDICVDELGREPKKSFKQKGEAYNTEGTNVMAVYLENAYKFKRIAHMISNEQDFDTFANYYGPHVADRLFSYYNIVEYRTDAPSRRTPPYTN